ncbi:MAG: hypothetical protein ACXABO_00960 [Promethearchaeota archaeon]
MYCVVDSTVVANYRPYRSESRIYGKLQTVSSLTVMVYKDSTRSRVLMWLLVFFLF